jgi:hypothetical protein
MEQLLDQNTYQYYSKTQYEQLERGSDSEYLFSEIGTTAEYREDYGLLRDTEALYTVFSFTDEKKEEIMAFFEDAKLCTSVDRTVQSIVNEELSAWHGGVRTLEETTKIIDSRVWIYLNELSALPADKISAGIFLYVLHLGQGCDIMKKTRF